jgi:hypothetical protein
MRVSRRFAQLHLCSHPAKARLFQAETAKYSMNTGDFAARGRPLHNFRVTGLCMSCTRLMNKTLEAHEFH